MSKPPLKLADECVGGCRVHIDGFPYPCRPRSCVRFVEMGPPREESASLPPTGAALLAALKAAGGSLPYSDPARTVSGLTALRHRGLARVVPRTRTTGARVALTPAGEAL